MLRKFYRIAFNLLHKIVFLVRALSNHVIKSESLINKMKSANNIELKEVKKTAYMLLQKL